MRKTVYIKNIVQTCLNIEIQSSLGVFRSLINKTENKTKQKLKYYRKL